MPINDPRPESNALSTLTWQDSNSAWPQTWTYPLTWPTTTGMPTPTDEERFRFALELIVEGGLTHEAIARVAKKALRTVES